ncbi:App1 family protein [Halomonas sp. hl-4]|uniref:App1 family protein n=1 Tax=Halomonas sp. hl-4 TaxID=1761789 RepID=UPI000BB6D700|nr:phosphatase domain-containing protein [Halomonas sp. hl-4]SNY96551.1 Phosphatidate phosphatase APP1 [Halomonas sp. hl-4]
MAWFRQWASFVKRLVHVIAKPMKRDLGRGGMMVHPYRGYGSQHEVFVMGRVFRQAALGRAIPRRGMLRDTADVARRIFRRGFAGAEVELSLGGNQLCVTTDRDGYFDVHLPISHALPIDVSWHVADIKVQADGQSTVNAQVEIYVPPPEADLLVISDIDDTVMFTGVAEKLKMLYRLFVRKPHRRTAFPGVASLYQALHRGGSEKAERPILYVSRGPWAIYEMLEAFFQLNRIPVGPILFLREWGISLRHPWPRRAEAHKRLLIDRMLALFDELPCILIGDSGQHDPEVYSDIVRDYPGRIKAIYIRRVGRNPEREQAIQNLRNQLADTDCQLVLAADSVLIAEHARAQGYISARGLHAVKRDVAASYLETVNERSAN